MSSMQEIELQRYHKELVKDVESLVDKYRRAMEWDIAESDESEGDRLIIAAIQKALDAIKSSAWSVQKIPSPLMTMRWISTHS